MGQQVHSGAVESCSRLYPRQTLQSGQQTCWCLRPVNISLLQLWWAQANLLTVTACTAWLGAWAIPCVSTCQGPCQMWPWLFCFNISAKTGHTIFVLGKKGSGLNFDAVAFGRSHIDIQRGDQTMFSSVNQRWVQPVSILRWMVTKCTLFLTMKPYSSPRSLTSSHCKSGVTPHSLSWIRG